MKNVILTNYNTKDIDNAVYEANHITALEVISHLNLPYPEGFLEKIADLEQYGPNEKEIFRSINNKYSIFINFDLDKTVKIYHENKLIGCSKVPVIVLKNDFSQQDKNKRLYVEIHYESWSIYEED